MRKHCLSRDELSRIIDVEINNSKLDDDEWQLSVMLDDWHNWDLELICVTVLLSRILEQKQKQSIDVPILLQDIYKMWDEKGLLTFEQIGEHFVSYMLKCVRHKEVSIEDQLVEIRNQLSEYDYNFR